MHAMPQVPSGMQLHLPRVSYARFPNIQRAAICIHPRHAHTGHAYSASACSRRIPHLRGAMRITLSDRQKHRRQCRSANGLWYRSEHQNRVCSFARSNCRLLVCVPRFRATRGTKLFAHTPDGIPPWNAVHLQGTAFRFLICDCTTCLIMVRDRPMLAVNGASALMLEDGMPLLAYGIGTVCCVVIFAVSCCVAPCTFGTFQRMPRGGYAIDPMNGAIETSHESSGFSIAGILEIAQTLFDDCLR